MKLTKKSLRALSIALTCGAALAADNAAFAAGNTGEALDTYALDEIVVTADRVARHDIDTAATVEVLTHEDLSKTGAENIQQALRYSTGLIAHALGPAGTSEASYNSKIVIRGVEKGTLVLVDGIPINANGKYALDNIPVELVDRVEIVKGGGAVQYGSEATGGVINIITKGKRKNSIRGALGNYGRQNYAVNGQFENLGLSYTYDKTGKENHISAPASTGNYYNMFRVEHSAFNVRYDITDHLYFYDNYSHNTSHWIYRNAPRHDVDYKHALLGYDENIMRLHYDRDGLSATLFYNLFDHKADSYTSRRYNNIFDHTATESYAKALGIDLQKEWRLGGKNTLLTGANLTQDSLEYTAINATRKKTTQDYRRNVYSLFASWNVNLSSASRLTLSARETWTAGATDARNFSRFTPEIQYLYKPNPTTSCYLKAGQSFKIPTFGQLYGTSTHMQGNDKLKPQIGTHYEIGFKKDIKNQTWRVALYNYAIKDEIESSPIPHTDDYTYTNEDIRNTGLEVAWEADCGEGLGVNLGFSYSRPQKRQKVDAVGTVTSGDWLNYYGRIQLSGGLDWKKNKWETTFRFNYLGCRTRDIASQDSLKPQFFTNLQIIYRPTGTDKLYFTMDNLLDRRDIVSTSSSTFYALGRNFMLGYEKTF